MPDNAAVRSGAVEDATRSHVQGGWSAWWGYTYRIPAGREAGQHSAQSSSRQDSTLRRHPFFMIDAGMLPLLPVCRHATAPPSVPA